MFRWLRCFNRVGGLIQFRIMTQELEEEEALYGWAMLDPTLVPKMREI